MELSSQEAEIPIPPINSYGGGAHGNGHGHTIHHHPPPQNPSNGSSMQVQEDHVHGQYKKVVRYRECLKNHAAGMGGKATDGCGEFMPSGEEGTIEALNCSACHCHRNFHRKEEKGEPDHFNRKFLLGHGHGHRKNVIGIAAPQALSYPKPTATGNFLPSKSRTVTVPPHHRMIMSYSVGSLPLPSESDEQEEPEAEAAGGMVARPPQLQQVKKRFRTKFTQEQKEKMLNFADKVGWKIQKQEESVVQQFCQEIGVKRKVLKVWMHNNKHNLAKNNPPTA